MSNTLSRPIATGSWSLWFSLHTVFDLFDSWRLGFNDSVIHWFYNPSYSSGFQEANNQWFSESLFSWFIDSQIPWFNDLLYFKLELVILARQIESKSTVSLGRRDTNCPIGHQRFTRQCALLNPMTTQRSRSLKKRLSRYLSSRGWINPLSGLDPLLSAKIRSLNSLHSTPEPSIE